MGSLFKTLTGKEAHLRQPFEQVAHMMPGKLLSEWQRAALRKLQKDHFCQEEKSSALTLQLFGWYAVLSSLYANRGSYSDLSYA